MRYGLSDFMNINSAGSGMQRKLVVEIENIIHLFEPRISEVAVFILNINENKFRILKLSIEAKIRNFTDSKIAIFESAVDLNKHYFEFN